MKIFRIVFFSLVLVVFPKLSLAESQIFESLKVFNDTKNNFAELQNANKEDFLTYTLSVSNNTPLPLNGYVVSMDVSKILSFADIVDNGGGVVSGGVINFPALTLPAGASLSKSFKVRIKYFLSDNVNYKISATFGNSSVVSINEPKVLGAFVAPTTGSQTNAVFFALLVTLSFFVYRMRGIIFS